MLANHSNLLLAMIFLLFSTPVKIKENNHPLHVSTTEVDFNGKEKSLEISCRIFTDDFENALAKQHKTKIDLSKPEMHKAMDELVKKYVDTHLKFMVNGKLSVAKYIGFEKDDEATNIYLEIDNISSLQKLMLTNTVLFEMFDDQMNILHVEKAGLRKSTKANYPASTLSVSF